jgi:hypothetical protein
VYRDISRRNHSSLTKDGIEYQAAASTEIHQEETIIALRKKVLNIKQPRVQRYIKKKHKNGGELFFFGNGGAMVASFSRACFTSQQRNILLRRIVLGAAQRSLSTVRTLVSLTKLRYIISSHFCYCW